jgi:glycosyltransferase involved in cell wall biosynthesis
MTPTKGSAGDGELVVAYVACLPLPEDRAASNPAFSQAGTVLQESLLENLRAQGTHISQCFVLRSVPSFPRSKILASGFQKASFAGVKAFMMPFLNFRGLKTLSVGVSVVVCLTLWAWRNAGRRGRSILCYNLANPPGLAILLAGRITRTPVFAVVADLLVPGAGVLPNTLPRRLEHWSQTKCMSLFDGLIVLTQQMADDFAPHVPHIQVEGGIPDDLPGPATNGARHQEVDESKFIVMYSGSLSSFKGTPLLLDCFKFLSGDRYKLWITGSGDALPMVEEASRRDSRIQYLGRLPYKDVLNLYHSASVLVNPHTAEGASARYVFPSKLLEYLTAGRPVISTLSTPEVARTYGPYIFALKEETPQELARLIENLASLSAEDLRLAGEKGRRFVLDNKRWSYQAKRIATFLSATVLQ